MQKITKSNEEWKNELDDETYHVTREKGTEAPFTGKYYLNHDDGIYKCSNCGLEVFRSDEKYDSGSGWPSFWKPLAEDRVEFNEDNEFGMKRTEVVCARCGAHLGHVFDDGPTGEGQTGQRFCMNSVSLNFAKKEEKEAA